MARAAGKGVRIEPLTSTARGTAWRRTGKGPPLLLLHGGAGSASHWVRNIPHLAATRTVWVPDLPGMGDSADAPEPRNPEAIAGVLAADLRELLPPAPALDLVGFSFGGVVAGFLAGLLPAKPRTLVLVGSGGLGLRKRDERILHPWRHLADPQARAEAHRFNLAALMLHDAARIDGETLRLYAADVIRTRVNSAKHSRTDTLKQRIAELGIPVHGIWGRHDVTAHAKFDEIFAILRHAYAAAQLHVIEDAGHWVQYEQPEAFNKALACLLP